MSPPPGIKGRELLPPIDPDRTERRVVEVEARVMDRVDDRLREFRKDLRSEWKEDLKEAVDEWKDDLKAASDRIDGKLDLLTKIVQERPTTGLVGQMGGRQASVVGVAATFVVSVIVGLVAHYSGPGALPAPSIVIEAPRDGRSPPNPIAPDPHPVASPPSEGP